MNPKSQVRTKTSTSRSINGTLKSLFPLSLDSKQSIGIPTAPFLLFLVLLFLLLLLLWRRIRERNIERRCVEIVDGWEGNVEECMFVGILILLLPFNFCLTIFLMTGAVWLLAPTVVVTCYKVNTLAMVGKLS